MIGYIWEKVNTVENKTNKKYDVMSVMLYTFLILASVRKYDIHIYKEQKIRTISEISMIGYIWEK